MTKNFPYRVVALQVTIKEREFRMRLDIRTGAEV